MVLVAEDEEYNFLYLQELFANSKTRLIQAKNGIEAIEWCKSGTKIDLILMDIKMPHMDGYTAAKIIKEQHPKLPVIAQSAYAMEDEIQKFSDAFDGYVTKPIKRQELYDLVSKYVKV